MFSKCHNVSSLKIKLCMESLDDRDFEILSSLKKLKSLEKVFDFKREKVFKDPRLILFYAWLKGKYTNQKT